MRRGELELLAAERRVRESDFEPQAYSPMVDRYGVPDVLGYDFNSFLKSKTLSNLARTIDDAVTKPKPEAPSQPKPTPAEKPASKTAWYVAAGVAGAGLLALIVYLVTRKK